MEGTNAIGVERTMAIVNIPVASRSLIAVSKM